MSVTCVKTVANMWGKNQNCQHSQLPLAGQTYDACINSQTNDACINSQTNDAVINGQTNTTSGHWPFVCHWPVAIGLGPLGTCHQPPNTWHITHKMSNKQTKYKNSNGKSVLKVLHCNFGPRMWVNKIEDIECLANDHTPDIIFVSEAKVYINDLDYMTKIDGYKIYHANTMQRHGYARMVMLVKPNLNIEMREEWMDPDSASIWVSIKRKGHKRINLGGGVYREHRLLQQHPDSQSHTDTEQNARWSVLVNNWVKASVRANCF